MNDLNSVLLEGTITRRPVLSYTPEGEARCSCTICSERLTKRNDEYTKEYLFMPVELRLHTAELFHGDCDRGMKVRLVGRLTERGSPKHRKTVLAAEHFERRPVAREKTP